ncbi:MAG TPA: RNA polymerase sigma factor [Solirubrobacteraceae bacterium]|nr:RNA polymerase sigma factor [Solirubrobacteraceae bacterium]
MNAAERDATDRFSEMYGALYGRVHAYAERRVGRQAADEVAAETFLVAWRRLEAIPGEPLPWLYGVARNVVLRHRAGHARQAAARDALELERPATEPAESDDAELRAAWARLSESDRELLGLIAWEELTVADAARSLGCSAPVFSVRLHRARKRLERLLQQPTGASPRVSELSEAS